MHPVELVAYQFKDAYAGLGERAPNLEMAIKRFNEENFWVAAEICLPTKPKEQAHLLSKFIEVADRCRELGNFFSVFSILGALNMSQVSRLKAWRLLPGIWCDMPRAYWFCYVMVRVCLSACVCACV